MTRHTFVLLWQLHVWQNYKRVIDEYRSTVSCYISNQYHIKTVSITQTLNLLFEWIDTKWKVLTYCESDSALHCRKNPRLFVVLSLSCPWLLLGMAMIFLQMKETNLTNYYF